jgi:hypothetical protein
MTIAMLTDFAERFARFVGNHTLPGAEYPSTLFRGEARTVTAWPQHDPVTVDRNVERVTGAEMQLVAEGFGQAYAA